MSLPVEFHPAVRREIADAVRWYEQRCPGLGTEFFDAVQALIAEIQVQPSRFGFATGTIREGMLSRFPFAVYYRILRGRIRILAVHHAARDPSVWLFRN